MSFISRAKIGKIKEKTYNIICKNIQNTDNDYNINDICNDEYFYRIPLFSPLKLEHIESQFDSCNYLKKRNVKYYWLIKLLRELVECYGNKIEDAKDPIFHHSVDNLYLYFDKFEVY